MALRHRSAVTNFAFGINQYETDVPFKSVASGDIGRVSNCFAAHYDRVSAKPRGHGSKTVQKGPKVWRLGPAVVVSRRASSQIISFGKSRLAYFLVHTYKELVSLSGSPL